VPQAGTDVTPEESSPVLLPHCRAAVVVLDWSPVDATVGHIVTDFR